MVYVYSFSIAGGLQEYIAASGHLKSEDGVGSSVQEVKAFGAQQLIALAQQCWSVDRSAQFSEKPLLGC